MVRTFEIYTDGACKGNGTKDGGFGGWAYVILEDRKIVKQGSEGRKDTTNNKMEMISVIEALKNFSTSKEKHKIRIYSDSAYVVNCFREKWYEKWQLNNWKGGTKGEIQNRELWEELIDLYFRFDVTFEKVKGHAGDEFNELVDTMASGAAKRVR